MTTFEHQRRPKPTAILTILAEICVILGFVLDRLDEIWSLMQLIAYWAMTVKDTIT